MTMPTVALPGLMPISGAKNETRKLFFWFFPAKDVKNLDDIVYVPTSPAFEGHVDDVE